MKSLIDVASRQPIRDVVLLCAIDDGRPLPSLSQAQGGPTFVQFEDTCFVVEQPLGREEIQCTRATIDHWAKTKYDPDYDYAVFSVFEIAYYRRNEYDDPPYVNRIEGWRIKNGTSYAGLVLHLSTGALIGFDASSDRGLRLFFDRQLSMFEKEYTVPLLLLHEDVWQREAEVD